MANRGTSDPADGASRTQRFSDWLISSGNDGTSAAGKNTGMSVMPGDCVTTAGFFRGFFRDGRLSSSVAVDSAMASGVRTGKISCSNRS